MLDLLLKAGLKLNVVDYSGQTPIIYAAATASSEIVAAMLNAGAAVNSVDKSGWSALMNAARAGRIENVRALLKAGADPRLTLTRTPASQKGLTAYDIALQNRNQHCAVLIQKTAE